MSRIYWLTDDHFIDPDCVISASCHDGVATLMFTTGNLTFQSSAKEHARELLKSLAAFITMPSSRTGKFTVAPSSDKID